MLLREIFEILHAVMAILVLFELSTSPNMVHFARTFSIVRA